MNTTLRLWGSNQRGNAKIADMALHVNRFMTEYLKDLEIELIDFKLEFGRTLDGIVLADEISPDTCRFWDRQNGRKTGQRPV